MANDLLNDEDVGLGAELSDADVGIAEESSPKSIGELTRGRPFISPDAKFEDSGIGFEPTMPPTPLFQSFVPLPEPIKGETIPGKIGAAAANFGIQTAGSIASPGGLLTAPLGALGRVGQVIGGLGL